MSDVVVSQKFTGNASDLERTIAHLEKKYEELNGKLSEGASKAKTAAMTAKAALKAEEAAVKAATEGATHARRVYYGTIERLANDEARLVARLEREQEQAKRTATAGAMVSKKVYYDTIERLRKQEESASQKALNDEMKISRDVYRTTLARLKLEEDAEKQAEKRELTLKREAAAVRKQLARDEARQNELIAKQHAASVASLERWATGVGSMALGYVGIQATLGKVISQHDEVMRQAEELGNRLDENARKLMVLSGQTPQESKVAQAELEKIAFNVSTTPENANAAAMGLSTVGFPQRDLLKGAEFILKLQAAGGELGNDPQRLSEDLSKGMASRGLEMNLKNLMEYAIPLYLLGKPTSLKLSDTQQFASKSIGVAAALKNPLHENALQAMAIKYAGSEKGSTAADSFIGRLTGASGDKERIDQLAMLQMTDEKTGLKRKMTPADVAFDDEDFPKVLSRLAQGTSGLNEMQSNVFFERFFGKGMEGSLARAFIRDRADLDELTEGQKKTEIFEQDVQKATSGPAAASRRFKERENKHVAAQHNDAGAIIRQLDLMNWEDAGQVNGGIGWTAAASGNVIRNLIGSASSYLGGPDWQMQWLAGSGGPQRIHEAIRRAKEDKREELDLGSIRSDFVVDQQANERAGITEINVPGAAPMRISTKTLDKFKSMTPEALRSVEQDLEVQRGGDLRVAPMIPNETRGDKKLSYFDHPDAQAYFASLPNKNDAGRDETSQKMLAAQEENNKLMQRQNELLEKAVGGKQPAPTPPPKRPRPVNADE